MAVRPSRLDEQTPDVLVAGLGDRELPAALAGGILANSEADIAHEIAGRAKALQVAQFDSDSGGSDESNSLERLERLDEWLEARGLDELGYILLI